MIGYRPRDADDRLTLNKAYQDMNKRSDDSVAKVLFELLADSYTLYLKTHNYHWNVTGPMFTTLHSLFETQYVDLAAAVDEIAERIRSIGAFAPGSYSAFMELGTVQEENAAPTRSR